MDDLSSTINSILGSEEGMAQLRSVAGALGLNMPQNMPPQAPSAPLQQGYQNPAANMQGQQTQYAMSQNEQMQYPLGTNAQSAAPSPELAQLLAQLQGALSAPNTKPTPPAQQGPIIAPGAGGGQLGLPGGIDLATIAKLQRAYSAFTARDKNTDLLMAVKPHLSDERQKKVDDAIKILGLLKLWPMIKESGILDSLGGLLGGDET